MPAPGFDEPEDDLPGSLTPLVGRDRELDELAHLVRDGGARLVTLVGPGGVGKSRLAIELGASLRGEFPDGARFVPLAGISDPALVLPTVARYFGLRDTGTRPLRARLRDELRERSLLLILDNFEQVLPAAEAIGQLLVDCPELRIVATSRARLAVRGERVVPVAPLGLPRDGEPARSPLSYPAVQLLVARARDVDATFAPEPAEAATLVEICRRLDGLPLAIELAAARLRVLPPPALLARLERRLPLLTGGARDLPERQRTLRDAIAWSYGLLRPEEQALFRRLSVFTGGFTLNAAEAVAGDGSRETDDGERDSLPAPLAIARQPPTGFVLDGLAALTDWSLLLREPVGTGEAETDPRYELLETVREFGLEHLEAAGEADAARDRHADFFTDLARQARGNVTGRDQARWLERLEFEHDNLRAAFERLVARGEAERVLALASDLWQFWRMRGYLAEGRRRLTTALALPGATEATAERMRALIGAGALAEAQGDDGAAAALLEEAIALGQPLARPDLLAVAQTFRGLVAFDLNQHEAATKHCEDGLSLAESVEDAWCAGIALVQFGLVATREHEYDRAANFLERSLDRFRAIADQSGIAVATGALGILTLDRQEPERAAPLLAESLALFQAQGDRWGVAAYMEAAARIACERGQPTAAAFLFGAVKALHDNVGIVVKGVYRQSYQQTLDDLRRRLGEAAFKDAFDRGCGATPIQAVAMAVRAADATPEDLPGAEVRTAPAPTPSHRIGLTEREKDVLNHLVDGLTDREIGAALFIGHRTVATHVTNILNTLGVNSRTAAAATAVRLGLV